MTYHTEALGHFSGPLQLLQAEEKVRKGRDGKPLPGRTPAMKLGTAKGLVRIEDILYFDPDRPESAPEWT